MGPIQRIGDASFEDPGDADANADVNGNFSQSLDVSPTLLHISNENLPEVVDDNFPQVVNDDSPEVRKLDDDTMKHPRLAIEESCKEVVFQRGTSEPSPASWAWWRQKKRRLLLAAIAAIILISVVVGPVVGTWKGSQLHEYAPDRTFISNLNTICGGILCPQILTTSILGRDTDSNHDLFLFARGVDNAIWYNSASTETLNVSSGWPSDRLWRALPGGPQFFSQPTAIAWGQQSKYVSVAAVSSLDGIIRSARFQFAESGNSHIIGEWEDLGGPVDSPLAGCSGFNGTRPDWFAKSGDAVAQNWWEGNSAGTGAWIHSTTSGNAKWHPVVESDPPVASRPAVICREPTSSHGMAVYRRDGDADVYLYSTSNSTWMLMRNDLVSRSKFQGEPIAVGLGGRRIDFFGVGEDAAMRRLSVEFSFGADMGSLTKETNLGGSFQSVPAVVATGLGSAEVDRIDVVAVGTNGNLHHRAMGGDIWTSKWEDLGVAATSAPILVNLGELVGVFVVGVGGQIKYTMWNVSSELNWKNLEWRSMGGNMTTAFHPRK